MGVVYCGSETVPGMVALAVPAAVHLSLETDPLQQFKRPLDGPLAAWDLAGEGFLGREYFAAAVPVFIREKAGELVSDGRQFNRPPHEGDAGVC